MSENQAEKSVAPKFPNGPDAKRSLASTIQILLASVPLPTEELVPGTKWVERGGAKTDPTGIY